MNVPEKEEQEVARTLKRIREERVERKRTAP